MQSLSRAAILEAVLFAAGLPLSLPKLAEEAEYFCADLQAAISW